MARKVVLGTSVGGVQSAIAESSKLEALWSELFTEKERNLMRKRLEHGEVDFSLDSLTLSVHIRFIRQPPPPQQSHLLMAEPVALVLHDVEGRLTDSWAWSKLVLPLHERGFSVVLVDLPGCGRSSVCGTAQAEYKTWRHKGWRIVNKVMDRLQIGKAHLVATGEGCHIATSVMQHLPTRVERFHVFHNPAIHLECLTEAKLPPGCTPERVAELRRQQTVALQGLLQKLDLRIWMAFDARASAKSADVLDVVRSVWDRMGHGSYFTVSHVERQDLTTARVGSVVTACALFPSRGLKSAWVRFLQSGTCQASYPAVAPEARPDCELSQKGDQRRAPSTASALPRVQLQDAPLDQEPSSDLIAPAGEGHGHATALWAASERLPSPPALGHTQRHSSEPALQRWAMSPSKGSGTSLEYAPSIASSRCRSQVSLPRTEACHMRAASLAAAVNLNGLLDVTAERNKRVLAGARPAAKQSLSELRSTDESELDPNLTVEERGWLQDALDESMATLEEDSRRRGRKDGIALMKEEKSKAKNLRKLWVAVVVEQPDSLAKTGRERSRARDDLQKFQGEKEKSDGFGEIHRASRHKGHRQMVSFSNGFGDFVDMPRRTAGEYLQRIKGAQKSSQEELFQKAGGFRHSRASAIFVGELPLI